MPSIEPLPLVVATLAFLIAGFVKGVIGLGLPTVSMGLLSLVMPPAKAASLLIVPSFVTNVWQLAAGPSFARLACRLWPMLAGVVLGTLPRAGLLTGSHAGQAAVALGLLLMLYAGLGLTSVRFSAPPAAEWWLAPAVGALTGLLTAATGVFAIPAVPYIGALGLDKDDMIQALGLSFTVSTVALAAALAAGGAFALGDAGASTAALAPALLGMAAGGAVRAASASRPFGACSSADCWCSALTSRRGRCSDAIEAAHDALSLTIRPRHNTTAYFAQPYGPLRYSRKWLSSRAGRPASLRKRRPPLGTVMRPLPRPH
jgi:uncharacterized protein